MLMSDFLGEDEQLPVDVYRSEPMDRKDRRDGPRLVRPGSETPGQERREGAVTYRELRDDWREALSDYGGSGLRVQAYGPGDDDWLFVLEPAASDDSDEMARRIERCNALAAALRQSGVGKSDRTVSGPQVEALAERLEGQVAWSALQEGRDAQG